MLQTCNKLDVVVFFFFLVSVILHEKMRAEYVLWIIIEVYLRWPNMLIYINIIIKNSKIYSLKFIVNML